MNMQLIDKIKKLPINVIAQYIKNYDYSYFILNKQLITDQTYDAIESIYNKKLKESDIEAPYVPGTASYKIRQVPHTIPMGSLNRVYDIEGVDKWLKKYEPFDLITISLKLDGIAYSATYQDGNLINVLTRGGKTSGEDITIIVKDITKIPTKIKTKGTIVIRGELFIPVKDLDLLNKNRLEPYPTPRHAVGAMLISGKNNGVEVLCSICKVYVNGKIGKSLQRDIINYSSLDGFVYNPYTVTHVEVVSDVLSKKVEDIMLNGHHWPYDGFVLSTDGDSGVPSKSWNKPRDLLAYKLPSARAITTITEHYYDIKQDGQIIVKGKLKPVKVGPVTAVTANLHNTKMAFKDNYYPGKRVYAELTGDAVITIKPLKGSKIVEVVEPKECPFCKGHLVSISGMLHCYNAVNSEDKPLCFGAHMVLIKRFFSSSGINLTGFGPKKLKEVMGDNNLMMPSEIIEKLLITNPQGLNSELLLDLDVRTERSIVYGFGSLPLKFNKEDAIKFYNSLPEFQKDELMKLTKYSGKLLRLLIMAGVKVDG